MTEENNKIEGKADRALHILTVHGKDNIQYIVDLQWNIIVPV